MTRRILYVLIIAVALSLAVSIPAAIATNHEPRVGSQYDGDSTKPRPEVDCGPDGRPIGILKVRTTIPGLEFQPISRQLIATRVWVWYEENDSGLYPKAKRWEYYPKITIGNKWKRVLVVRGPWGSTLRDTWGEIVTRDNFVPDFGVEVKVRDKCKFRRNR